MLVSTTKLTESEAIAKTEADSGLLPYSCIDSSVPMVDNPTEFHQATIHFALHPNVPVLWKVFYVVTCLGTITLQILALIGLLSDVENLTVMELKDLFLEMSSMDYYMLVVVAILSAMIVYGETSQARTAEAMLREAFVSDATPNRAAVVFWGFPLLVAQKARRNVLVPITVCTAPVLAIHSGVDALNVALNVMAILFVFDFDDSIFSIILSNRQKAYLETVEVTYEYALSRSNSKLL